MAISLANITGIVLNGFTAPVFNMTVDTPPAGIQKQSVVSSFGGTLTGARVHSPSDPFTIAILKGVAAAFPKVNLQGFIGRAGRNKYTFLLRKGTIPLVGQTPQVSDLRIELNVVSGAEVNDKANVAALLSAGGALLNREAANYLDTAFTGVA